MDDIELQEITNRLHVAESILASVRNTLKTLPLVENMAKDVEFKVVQQYVVKICTQQKHRTIHVSKLQDEVEQVMVTIHPLHN